MRSLARGQQETGRAFALLVFCCLLFVGCKLKSGPDWSYKEQTANLGPSLTDQIDFLKERLKDRPKSFLEQAELAGYYLQRGKAQRSPDDTEAALEWLERSLSEQENPAALMVKADYLQMRHQFQESLAITDRVLQMSPGHLKAVMMGVQVSLAQGNTEEAKQRLQALPDTPLSSHLFLRGQVAEADGEDEKAREFYQQAIFREADSGSQSESARMRAILARLEMNQGNSDEAERLLESAHAIAVEQPLTEVLRARLMVLQRRHEQATSLLRAAFEHYRDPLFLVRLGEIQMEVGQPEEARSSFAAAAQILQDDPFGHERDLALALYYIDAEENKERVEELMTTELQRRQDEETLRIAELVKSNLRGRE
jgi:tetratricopeptide (TPR) repeat protein